MANKITTFYMVKDIQNTVSRVLHIWGCTSRIGSTLKKDRSPGFSRQVFADIANFMGAEDLMTFVNNLEING